MMAMKARYTVANGRVIAQKRSGTRHYLASDPLGSTIALFNATQTKTDTWVYWPYGEVKTRTGTTTIPFQFVGTLGYYNDNSSRAYVRARELDLQKGRWLTEDRIAVGVHWNLYAYADRNPMSSSDPSGLLPRCFWECLVSALWCAWCLTHPPDSKPTKT
jgi:RHS repeat-associated protein